MTERELIFRELDGLENRREATRAWARDLLPRLVELFEKLEIAGLDGIGTELNYANIPARRGGKWQRTTVMRLLNIGLEQSMQDPRLDKLRELADTYREDDFPAQADDAALLYSRARERWERGAEEARLLQQQLQAAIGWRNGRSIHYPE